MRCELKIDWREREKDKPGVITTLLECLVYFFSWFVG